MIARIAYGALGLFVLGMLLMILTFWLISVPGVPDANAASPAASKSDEALPASLKPDILEIVNVNDEIDDSTATSLADKVKQINKNPLIKAVLLELDTPGGGVAASVNSYEELKKLKVPVVVWCNSVCASGGMLIAMTPSVKYIAIRQQTVAGSIGVIMQMQSYNRLLDWARIDNSFFTSGEFKATGHPERALTDPETKYLQGIVDQFAGEFYDIVAKARGKKITDWVAIKSARIFIGQDAVKVGLVDGIMTEEQAIAKAKALSGSRAIFTRAEIQEVAGNSDSSSSSYGNDAKTPAPSLMLPKFQMDALWAIDKAKEILGGSSVHFKYLMPLSF